MSLRQCSQCQYFGIHTDTDSSLGSSHGLKKDLATSVLQFLDIYTIWNKRLIRKILFFISMHINRYRKVFQVQFQNKIEEK